MDVTCRGIEAILEMPVLLMFAEHDSAFLDTMFKAREDRSVAVH